MKKLFTLPLLLIATSSFGDATSIYKIPLLEKAATKMSDIMIGVGAKIDWNPGDKRIEFSLNELVCFLTADQHEVHCSYRVEKQKSLFARVFGKTDPTPKELEAQGFTRFSYTVQSEISDRMMGALRAIGVETTTEIDPLTGADGALFVRAKKMKCTADVDPSATYIGTVWDGRRNTKCLVTVDPNSKTAFTYVMHDWKLPVSESASKEQL